MAADGKLSVSLGWASAAGLPSSGLTEVWLVLRLGEGVVRTPRLHTSLPSLKWSSRVQVDGERSDLPVRVSVMGARFGREVVLARLMLDHIDDYEQDVTLGVGAKGTVRFTVWNLEGKRPHQWTAMARGAAERVHGVVGSNPVVPPPRSSRDSMGGDPDERWGFQSLPKREAGPSTYAKLEDLLVEFFCLESTASFVSLAVQNVKVGLAADASISPFAKPRLPRAPRHLPQRWSVSGSNLVTPQKAMRTGSLRQTWHTAEPSLLLPIETRELFRSPDASPKHESRDRRSRRSLNTMKAELITSAQELGRHFRGGDAANDSAETSVSTYWLPVPAISGDRTDSPQESARAELPSGERISLDEALARNERSVRLGIETEHLRKDDPSSLLPPPNPLEKVRLRRRSSVMTSQPDDILARRVRDAFAAKGVSRVNSPGESPDSADTGESASLGYVDFLDLCNDVLELPHYVGHAIFEEVATGLGRDAVLLSDFHDHLGGFKVIGDDRRRVFHALTARRAFPGSTESAKTAIRPRREVEAQVVERVVRGVLRLHPGLTFLQDHDEFKEAYVRTVTVRILFAIAGPGHTSIPWSRWKGCDITDVLYSLQDERDINVCPDYFSYNDFYVVWCLFWELDEDEDSALTAEDLQRYNNYALSPRAVSRVIAMRMNRAGNEQVPASESAHVQAPAAESRQVSESQAAQSPRMSYEDFVRFLVAEEVRRRTRVHYAPTRTQPAQAVVTLLALSSMNHLPPVLQDKSSPSSLRYWFHILDVDADGLLGRRDVEYFYEEQYSRCAPRVALAVAPHRNLRARFRQPETLRTLLRMVELGEEPIEFAELFNEIHDMINPSQHGQFTLAELVNSGLAVQVMDALTNIRKIVAWEALASQKAAGRPTHLRGTRDWDVFMEQQYKRLVEADDEKEHEEGEEEQEGEDEVHVQND